MQRVFLNRRFTLLLRHSSRIKTWNSMKCMSTHSFQGEKDANYIRNIGIIAHIDAGKTTTTERMLYYSGFTQRIGNVDEGSTVTDFLPQERERGITINSACIPFGWNQHRINLIDTPGHVDFTIEVERCVRVLDGAVVILDGVAGVEAQTENVWKQANRNHIPRILFINKMDREGAAAMRALEQVEHRLPGWGKPMLIQWPIVLDSSHRVNGPASGGPAFQGVIDLLSMEGLDFSQDATGSHIQRYPLTSLHTEYKQATQERIQELYQECVQARTRLVEALSEMDDVLLEVYLTDADGDATRVTREQLDQALRRVTCAGKAVPVLLGASFRNIGVQPVMDAIVHYLPSPIDRPPTTALVNKKQKIQLDIKDNTTCALAFKVVHDPKRGPLVFVRVYSGTLEPRATLLNTTQHVKERASKLLQMYADDYEEIPRLIAGNIGALYGLKETRTGDTLIVSKKGHSHDLQLSPIPIPPPVFFCSIEPETKADEEKFEEALKAMMREDPSLHISIDTETNQTLLGGMGELHLEIAKGRLKETHRVAIRTGPVMIGYRETVDLEPQESITETFVYSRDILGRKAWASVTVSISSVHSLYDLEELQNRQENGNKIEIELDESLDAHPIKNTPGSTSATQESLDIQKALISGVQQALSRGPFIGYPVTNIHARITAMQKHPTQPELSTPSAIRAAAYKATLAAIKTAAKTTSTSNVLGERGKLLEPLMHVIISVPEKYLGLVSRDVGGSRRGTLVSMEDDADSAMNYMYHRVHAKMPLSSMIGYSTSLRGMTQGTGHFMMELAGYGVVQGDKASLLLQTY